jgi:hypothetical protein
MPGFGQAAHSVGNAIDGAFRNVPAPTNAWVPGAIVSLLLPGLGLFFIRDGKSRGKLALVIFVGYFVASVALGIVAAVLGAISAILAGLFGLVSSLFHLAVHILAMLHTHDETVRAYPHLGNAIVFKKPVELPSQLK